MSKKNNSNSNRTSGDIGFCGLLAIVFITLKLLGKITWSWLWVLSPIWIPIAIFLFILLIVFLAAIVKAMLKDE